MIGSAENVIGALRRELDGMLSSTEEGSPVQAVLAAARVLDIRERGGAGMVRGRLSGLGRLIEKVLELLGDQAQSASAGADLTRIAAEVSRAAKEPDLAALEAAWLRLAGETETALSAVTATKMSDGAFRARLTALVGAWECDDRTGVTRANEAGAAPEADISVTPEKLATYLRHRFDDPTLAVTAFRPLAGGFGKQTILFDVEGRALTASLVMRRDMGEPTIDNDCHRIRLEYPVLRAANAHGFPAPELVWADTEHKLLPGGDFVVVRRAPGETGGNVFRATAGISEDLSKVLAGSMARLHRLPPLTELGDLTDSIRAEWWSLSLHDCIEHYIRGWYDYYLNGVHDPSPALVSLYGWLFDNIPSPAGKPVLLHGDIGFHNMMVHDGRLSALLDWEFAHIGDPAEDVGYVKNIGGIDWDRFMGYYRAAGGPEIDPVRLHFFQVWGQVRNASASNLSIGAFTSGRLPFLKLFYTGHFHLPHFIRAACDLVEAGPGKATRPVDY